MNVELLMRVKQHILENPARLRMDRWKVNRKENYSIVRGDQFDFYDAGYGEPRLAPIPPCNTVACVAGWTMLLGNPDEGVRGYGNIQARELLGISYPEAADLFHVDRWDVEPRQRYYHAQTQEERAQIVGEVIDAFIAEHQAA